MTRQLSSHLAAGPVVRILLPPPASQRRTCLSEPSANPVPDGRAPDLKRGLGSLRKDFSCPPEIQRAKRNVLRRDQLRAPGRIGSTHLREALPSRPGS